MARLYANENFPPPVVESLRKAGHDVITVAETGKAEQACPDEDVLEFAAQDDRVLLTLNRKHFIRLHHQRPDHAGIVVCTVDPDFARLAKHIDNAIKTPADLRGQLVRVSREQAS
jgi:predicted nuclease of predicted toxin-antitoxin system